jgi:hypothetical protein
MTDEITIPPFPKMGGRGGEPEPNPKMGGRGGEPGPDPKMGGRGGEPMPTSIVKEGGWVREFYEPPNWEKFKNWWPAGLKITIRKHDDGSCEVLTNQPAKVQPKKNK